MDTPDQSRIFQNRIHAHSSPEKFSPVGKKFGTTFKHLQGRDRHSRVPDFSPTGALLVEPM
jgi:hypothetical protein